MCGRCARDFAKIREAGCVVCEGVNWGSMFITVAFLIVFGVTRYQDGYKNKHDNYVGIATTFFQTALLFTASDKEVLKTFQGKVVGYLQGLMLTGSGTIAAQAGTCDASFSVTGRFFWDLNQGSIILLLVMMLHGAYAWNLKKRCLKWLNPCGSSCKKRGCKACDIDINFLPRARDRASHVYLSTRATMKYASEKQIMEFFQFEAGLGKLFDNLVVQHTKSHKSMTAR